MRYRVATVIFKGNNEKKYDFFVEDICLAKGNVSVEAACCHVGDWCLCDTSAGLTVGKVVDIKTFDKRPAKCYRFILWYTSPSQKDYLTGKYHPGRVKELIEAEKEDDIFDFLND